MNYKNKNTRKNKKGGDATLPFVGVAAAVIAGAAAATAVASYKNITKKNNESTKNRYRWRNREKPISNNHPSSEDENLGSFINKHNLVREPIPDDGNCLFIAFLKFLDTPDEVLYENASESPHNNPKLSVAGKEKVKKLRIDMVEWMQGDESKEDGQTFWEKYQYAILGEDPYYDPAEPRARETMYDNLADYVSQMTRIEPDETRKKAQFGTMTEITALVKMRFNEPNFLQLVVVDDNGSLSLHTFPDKPHVGLHSIDINMPILLLKAGHFEILNYNQSPTEGVSHL